MTDKNQHLMRLERLFWLSLNDNGYVLTFLQSGMQASSAASCERNSPVLLKLQS